MTRQRSPATVYVPTPLRPVGLPVALPRLADGGAPPCPVCGGALEPIAPPETPTAYACFGGAAGNPQHAGLAFYLARPTPTEETP